MDSSSALGAVSAFILFLDRLAHAVPQLEFPPNAQFPPVAYVAQSYEFVLTPDTFSSQQSAVSYALLGQPSWLSVANDRPRIVGTPASNDAGLVKFQLLASDSTGQSSTEVTIIVAKNRTISTAADQLAEFMKMAKVSAPGTLLLHPREKFLWNVSPQMFTTPTDSSHLDAASADGSPLPSWLQFSSSSLNFSGTAPPLLGTNTKSQKYDLKLVASTVAGFSEAEIPFQVEVASRILYFVQPEQHILVARGAVLSIPSLLETLFLDIAIAQRSDLISVWSNAPEWLTFSEQNLSFQGSVPADVQSIVFSISATALGTNTANASISLQVSSAPPTAQVNLGTINLPLGTYFTYTLQDADAIKPKASYSVDLGPSAVWLTFDAGNLTVHGFVLRSVTLGASVVTFTSDTDVDPHIKILILNIVPELGSPSFSLSAAPSTTRPAAPPDQANTTITSINSKPGQPSTQTVLKLSLGIGLTMIAALIALACIILTLKRHRKKHTHECATDFSPGQAYHSDMAQNGNAERVDDTQQTSVHGEVPQIDFSWAPESIRRATDQLTQQPGTPKTASITWASWDDLIRPSATQRDGHNEHHNQSHIFESPAHVAPPILRPFSRVERCRRSVFQVSNRVKSLRASQEAALVLYQARPSPEPYTNAGHGADLGHAFCGQSNGPAWRTTLAALPTANSRRTTVLLESFPTPPSNVNDSIPTNQTQKCVSGTMLVSRQSARGTRIPPGYCPSAESRSNPSSCRAQSTSEIHAPTSSKQSTAEAATVSESQRYLSWYMRRQHPRESRLQNLVNAAAGHIHNHSCGSGVEWKMEHGRTGHRYNASIASSRQFDSALSSDSGWEEAQPATDENLPACRQQPTVSQTSRLTSPTRMYAGASSQELVHEGVDAHDLSHTLRTRSARQATKTSQGRPLVWQPSNTDHGSSSFV